MTRPTMRPTSEEELRACRANLDALGIRGRLGRKEWRSPIPWGEGWKFLAHDGRMIIATWWPQHVSADGYDFGGDWIHASMSGGLGQMPSYWDLKLLHRSVFPNGHAYQCFVPPSEHINRTANVLHLWGRADGTRLLPDFGRFGDI